MEQVRTLAELPSARVAASRSLLTPAHALAAFEARRARGFALGLAVLCTFGVALAFVVGGDPLARTIHVGAVAATGLVAAAYVVFVGADVTRFRRWKLEGLVYVAILANGSGFYFYGVLSGYVAVVTMSAYAMVSGGGKRGMWGAFVLSVALHGGLGAAELVGWIAPRGLILAGPAMSPLAQALLLAVLQLVLFGGYALGGHAYETMARVLEEQHEVQQALAQREAQLAEANQAAREARGPSDGRYTGRRLGRFELREVLGRGAMGEIYAAVDDAGAPCAIKVLAGHLHGDAEAQRRFQREARAIAELAAPNIVRVLDVAPAGSEPPFFAMERLDGQDLGQLLGAEPVRGLGEIVAITRAVAAGLDAAHAAGVVHRDLKPSNVFAAEAAGAITWKVLDFGVSKRSGADATVTQGHLVGTPGYMAPEQAQGKDIDRRADIYSLGVLVYRMLTGRPAVMPRDVPAMLHEVVYRVPQRPGQLAAIGADVEAVLAIALAKAPSDRFATAGELAAALSDAVAGRLAPAVADRAARILARAPWGAWLERGGGRATTRAPTAKL